MYTYSRSYPASPRVFVLNTGKHYPTNIDCMQKEPLHKKFAAFMVAAALTLSVFGAVGIQPVRAETNGSAVSTTSNDSIIRLLEDLIKLLTQQLEVIMKERGVPMTTSDDDSDDSDDDSDSCDASGELELEADIFTNETVVEVTIDGDTEIFITDADSRAEIIDALLEEYDELDEADVDDALEVEEEDRASRASDKTVDDSDGEDCDDKGDDDSDDDDDEDEDDDNSGHGNDDDDDDDDEEDDD